MDNNQSKPKPGQQAGETAKNAGKTALKTAAKKGAKFATKAAATAALGPEAAPLVDVAFKVLENKEFQRTLKIIALLYIAIWLLILGLVVVILVSFINYQNSLNQNNNLLTITKTGPDHANLGDTLVYQITVTYPNAVQDIFVQDKLPSGTKFATASGTFTYDTQTNTVSWKLSDNGSITPPINHSFSLTLTSTQDNLYVVNQAVGTAIPAPSAVPTPLPSPGGTGSPNNNCGGFYTPAKLKNNPYGNFGDPTCEIATLEQKNQHAQVINMIDSAFASQDPQNASKWPLIAQCESGYFVDAFNGNSTSGQGAYGLVQMNPLGKGNGQYDAGNVLWSSQITNATTYNKTILEPQPNQNLCYWGCARMNPAVIPNPALCR